MRRSRPTSSGNSQELPPVPLPSVLATAVHRTEVSPVNPFSFEANLPRVVFGAGRLSSLGEEVERLGARRAIVLCTPEQEALGNDVAARLGSRCAGVFPGAVMHVPIESARAAHEQVRALDADCAVAVGGGSTTGLGK